MAEDLRWMRLEEDNNWTLIIQLNGGGAAQVFRTGEDAQTIVTSLRRLADRIEHDVKGRASNSHIGGL